jgi:5-methylcytosine-specific restriction endonuclease McrA
MPSRPCSFPRCDKFAAVEGRCAEHQARKAFADRGPQAHYDGVHKKLRLLVFRRDGWKCVKCGWTPRIVREMERFGLELPPEDAIREELATAYKSGQNHLAADHIIPIPEREDLAANLANYQTLCFECHQKKIGEAKSHE